MSNPKFSVGEPVWDITESPRAADTVTSMRWSPGLEPCEIVEGSLGLTIEGWYYQLQGKPEWMVFETGLRKRPPPASTSLDEILHAERVCV